MNPTRPTISAILITKNEAHNLPACLAGLEWCDEIVVIDSNSTDGTAEIARTAGARVECAADWPGFGAQKNRALQAARGDWILSIDADERVGAALAQQLREAAAGGAADGFEIPRSSLFVGRYMKHGGWWPDRVLRLARRERARFTDYRVHERLEVEGRVGRVTEPLMHLSYRDFESVLRKLDRYSSDGAHELHACGRSATLPGAIAHAAWSGFRTYVLKRGFLDGGYGFLLAMANAQTSFWKYVKLRELGQRDRVGRD